jgi:hypothetical protein
VCVFCAIRLLVENRLRLGLEGAPWVSSQILHAKRAKLFHSIYFPYHGRNEVEQESAANERPRCCLLRNGACSRTGAEARLDRDTTPRWPIEGEKNGQKQVGRKVRLAAVIAWEQSSSLARIRIAYCCVSGASAIR